MILLCNNTLKSRQKESKLNATNINDKEESIEKEASKLNLKKEKELKSIPRIYYYSAGAIPIVFVFIFIICFIIKRLKTKSIHTSSSEEENLIKSQGASNNENINESSQGEANTMVAEQHDAKQKSIVKEEIKEIITLLLEFNENSTNNKTALDLPIRKHMENMKALPGATYKGTYKDNINYTVNCDTYEDIVLTNSMTELSIYYDRRDILIRFESGEEKHQIIFQNGNRIDTQQRPRAQKNEESDISIQEMKQHINLFLGNSK